LSNVIKYRSTNGEHEEQVIDSNARVNAIFEALWANRDAAGAEGFTEGLNAPTLEDITPEAAPEPKKKISSADMENIEKEIAKRRDEVLEDANRQKAQIMQQAIKEAKIKEQSILDAARESGYKEGLQQANDEIEGRRNELEAEYQAKEAELQQRIDELEPEFASLVVKYVEKLTGIIAAEDYNTVIEKSIYAAITKTKPSKYYRIHVPKEQYSYVCRHEDDIRNSVSEQAQVEIVNDASLTLNQCNIETDTCVIDCSLGTRLQTLTNSLTILSENREIR
jgi:flagellar assembly protein FliH